MLTASALVLIFAIIFTLLLIGADLQKTPIPLNIALLHDILHISKIQISRSVAQIRYYNELMSVKLGKKTIEDKEAR